MDLIKLLGAFLALFVAWNVTASTLKVEDIEMSLRSRCSEVWLHDYYYTTISKAETLKYLRAVEDTGYITQKWDCDDIVTLTASVARLAFVRTQPEAKYGLPIFFVSVDMPSGMHALILFVSEEGMFLYEPQTKQIVPFSAIKSITILHH